MISRYRRRKEWVGLHTGLGVFAFVFLFLILYVSSMKAHAGDVTVQVEGFSAVGVSASSGDLTEKFRKQLGSQSGISLVGSGAAVKVSGRAFIAGEKLILMAKIEGANHKQYGETVETAKNANPGDQLDGLVKLVSGTIRSKFASGK